ncbi:MAG TPA: FmdB family zinc ribbon protein [Steroidobacteraceae bacterium]|jgi:putative FmdB family regulatory protein|nr:FmdB family zinc ribbon protein [Steroidobacteraceae bacterium]
MPFYEYQCKSCGHELEAMQKVSDAPLRKCPHCGKTQLQRLMSAPVFRLKGAGWYETDFKGDKENQRNLADRPEADASKDVKDAGVTAKDGNGKDANGKDGKSDAKGTETKGTEAKSPDTPAAKEPTAAKDKPTGKAEKSARAAAGKGTSAVSRSSAKRPARKPAAKASRRR